MRVFVEQTEVKQALSDVRCNVCGRSISKDLTGYFEDHVAISKSWGYHSPYDGEMHIIDVCIGCYENWTASFTIPPKVSCGCYVAGDALCACVW